MEEKQKLTLGTEEILYYLFFGILFAAKGMGMDGGQRPFMVCMAVSLCCLAAKLCLTKHTMREWTVMAALVLLGLTIRKSSGEEAALWAVLVIIGMKNVPLKRLMHVLAAVYCITFACSVCAGILHIRDGVVVVHEKMGLGPVIRWSLGYTHPNVLHVSYFILAALLLYAFSWHGKKLWKASVLLFAGNLLVFVYSVSYTGILLVSAYLCLHLYLDCRKKIRPWEAVCLTAGAGILILFPIVGPLWLEGHNHALFRFFNELLSYRFELVYNIFHEYPVSLFGTRTVFTGNAHLTLDSSYAYLLMYYGVTGFTLFVAGLLYLVYRFAHTGRKKELAITLAVILAGVTEQFLFNLSFKNVLFIFMGEALFADFLRTDKNRGFWNRPFSLLPAGSRKIRLVWPQGLSAGLCLAKKERGRIGACAVILALCGAGLFAAAYRKPDSVYVYRWHTDYRGEDRVKLDMDRLPEDFNSLVLGYNGPDGEMFELRGNIVTLERMRAPVGGAVLGGMAGTVLAAAFYMGKGARMGRQGTKENEGIDRQ